MWLINEQNNTSLKSDIWCLDTNLDKMQKCTPGYVIIIVVYGHRCTEQTSDCTQH